MKVGFIPYMNTCKYSIETMSHCLLKTQFERLIGLLKVLNNRCYFLVDLCG